MMRLNRPRSAVAGAMGMALNLYVAAASSAAELVAELLEYVLPVERFVVSLPRSLGTS